MVIKVLGKGCKNCARLQQLAEKAAEELNIEYTIEKVTDINEIADYGVMKTPALVVNEKLVLQGQLPNIEKIKELLK